MTEKKEQDACPKCKTKKCIYREPENGDAPGASPRRYGAPITIVLYYLGPRFWVIQRNRMRPRPHWGQGWRKGGVRLLELEIRG